jgi:hypothetical protein
MRHGVAVALLVAALGCDGPIRREMVALLEATPAPPSTPCSDREARLARLEPVRTLVGQAYPARAKFDDPLPAALQARVMETPLTATTVDDWRCLMGDLQGFDPQREPNYAVGLGTLAALFFDKGAALLAAGQTEAGWTHVELGLRLYADPPAFQYIYFLGAQYFMQRARRLVWDNVPPTAVADRLVAAGVAGTLSRETFCQGMNEELLAHAVALYFGHFPAERRRLAARWGPASVAHLDAEWARRNRPGRAAWRTYADLTRVVREACPTGSLNVAEQRARAASARLPSRSQAALLEFTWQRIRQLEELQSISATLKSRHWLYPGPERE